MSSPRSYAAFTSYAREDAAFVRRLKAALARHDVEIWVDVEGILGGENWRTRIDRSIEQCRAFIFVISPASAASGECIRELARAIELKKQIVPVYHRNVDKSALTVELRDPGWVFLRDDDPFETGVANLATTLTTDLEWREQHARLTTRAREWLDSGESKGLLLRGVELRAAEQWLAQDEHADAVTATQTRYVVRSRRVAVTRRRLATASGCAIVLVTGIAATVAIGQRNRAIDQERQADSRQLSIQAEQVSKEDPSLAAVLAAEALSLAETPEARNGALTLLGRLSGHMGQLSGHSESVNDAVISPDGLTAVTASDDTTLKLWDLETRQQLGLPFSGHTDLVNSVAFRPGGRQIISGSRDGTVRIWDARSHRQVGSPLIAGQTVYAIDVSPDGKLVAAVDFEKTIRIWDLRTREPLGAPIRVNDEFVNTLDFSPDSRLLATGGDDKRVRIWDVESQRQVGHALTVAHDAVTMVAFDPDGELLASSSEDGNVSLWNVTTRRRVSVPIKLGKEALSVAFSPDGRTLATGGEDRAIHVWDITTGKLVGRPLAAGGCGVTHLSYSPDGAMLASTTCEEEARLWNMTWPSPSRVLEDRDDFATDVAFSPDSRTLAIASGESIRVRGLDGSLRLRIQVGDNLTDGVAFSPDGRLLAWSGHREVQVWSLRSRRIVAKVPRNYHFNTRGMAFSPDERTLAVSSDPDVLLYDLARNRIADRLSDGKDISADVRFSPDGRVLITAGDELRVWDVDRRKPDGPPMTGHLSGLRSIDVSSDGSRLVSGGEDSTIRIWDLDSRRQVDPPLTGPTFTVSSTALSPDGKTIASTQVDELLSLWDADLHRQLGTPLHGHTDTIASLTFSPDGRTLASASFDGSVRLWDALTWARDAATLRRALCDRARRSLTTAEWSTFLTDHPYQRTCPQEASTGMPPSPTEADDNPPVTTVELEGSGDDTSGSAIPSESSVDFEVARVVWDGYSLARRVAAAEAFLANQPDCRPADASKLIGTIEHGRFDVSTGVLESLTDACRRLGVRTIRWLGYPARTKLALAKRYLASESCEYPSAQPAKLARTLDLHLGRFDGRRSVDKPTAATVANRLCAKPDRDAWCTGRDLQDHPVKSLDLMRIGVVDHLHLVTCDEAIGVVYRSKRHRSGRLSTPGPWKCVQQPAPRGVADSLFYRCHLGRRWFRAVIA